MIFGGGLGHVVDNGCHVTKDGGVQQAGDDHHD
jgi:hypothetical protein